jgi:hypothetical protein
MTMWVAVLAIANISLAVTCGILLLSMDSRVKQIEEDVDGLFYDDDTTEGANNE